MKAHWPCAALALFAAPLLSQASPAGPRLFPRGAHAEDMLWMRADTHNRAKNHEAARAAAADYLQRFPSGTYAAPARSIITR